MTDLSPPSRDGTIKSPKMAERRSLLLGVLTVQWERETHWKVIST